MPPGPAVLVPQAQQRLAVLQCEVSTPKESRFYAQMYIVEFKPRILVWILWENQSILDRDKRLDQSGRSLGSQDLICMQTAAGRGKERFGCWGNRDSEKEDWKRDNKQKYHYICSLWSTKSTATGSVFITLQMTHSFTRSVCQMIRSAEMASVLHNRKLVQC